MTNFAATSVEDNRLRRQQDEPFLLSCAARVEKGSMGNVAKFGNHYHTMGSSSVASMHWRQSVDLPVDYP